jgi:hypothetical protein
VGRAKPACSSSLIDWWTPKQHMHVYGTLKPDFSMDKYWATIMHLAIKKDNDLEA